LKSQLVSRICYGMEHNYSLAIAPGSVDKDKSHKRKRQRTGQPNDPRRIWDKRNKTSSTSVWHFLNGENFVKNSN